MSPQTGELETLMGAKSYQSIKVDHPHEETHFFQEDKTSQATSKKHRLAFLIISAVAAALVATGIFSNTKDVSDPTLEWSAPYKDVVPVPEDETLFTMGLESTTSGEEQCFNNNGVPVGAAGIVDIQPANTFIGTVYQRKGNNCPCSFAQAECYINDATYGQRECSTLKIDGKDAAANGFPDVTLEYSLKVCNYNDENLIQAVSPPSVLQFFYPITGSNTGEQKFIVNEEVNGLLLKKGECKKETGKTIVSTSRAKYFMKSFLQGPQLSSGNSRNGFCFAYTFNRIDFKYDYGFGECKMRTELDCRLADGSGRKCKEYIDALDYECRPFKADFTAEACNDNNRDIQIQVGASNFKINTYQLKPNGDYRREKTPLMPTLKANACEKFLDSKTVDPCKPNFWQVGVQGSLYISDDPDKFYFKDKDCFSFSFDKLPVIDPDSKPSAIPTTTPTTSPTYFPTLSSKPSVKPTSKPSVSVKPSTKPSVEPSLSVKPSANPTPGKGKGKGKNPSKGKGKSPSKGNGRRQYRTRNRAL